MLANANATRPPQEFVISCHLKWCLCRGCNLYICHFYFTEHNNDSLVSYYFMYKFGIKLGIMKGCASQCY